MRRLCALLWQVVALPLILATAAVARTDDIGSVNVGRSMGRGLIVLRDPYVCAPVIRVRACLADLQTLYPAGDGNARLGSIPGVGARPYDRLRAYIIGGDAADLVHGLAWINYANAPRNVTPREAALIDGGIAATLFAAAAGDMRAQLPSIEPAIAAARTPAVGGLDLLTAAQRTMLAAVPQTFDSRGLGSYATMQHLKDLLAATSSFAKRIDARYPAAAFPGLQYGDDTRGFLRLGVGLSTLRELLELPDLAALPESQAFATRTLGRMVRLSPGVSSRAETVLASLSAADASTRRAAGQTLLELTTTVMGTLNQQSSHALVVGSAVAQLGYNAATFRDPNANASMQASLGAVLPLPGITASDRTKLGALLDCDPSDLGCARRTATAAVESFAGP